MNPAHSGRSPIFRLRFWQRASRRKETTLYRIFWPALSYVRVPLTTAHNGNVPSTDPIRARKINSYPADSVGLTVSELFDIFCACGPPAPALFHSCQLSESVPTDVRSPELRIDAWGWGATVFWPILRETHRIGLPPDRYESWFALCWRPFGRRATTRSRHIAF